MTRIIVALSGLLYFACSGSESRHGGGLFNIDSLVTAQIDLLNKRQQELNKKAEVGDQSTTIVIKPDSAGWAAELAVFRQLDIAGRPTNRDRYTVKDFTDPNSNLRVRSFEGEDTPVPMIRFFYLDGPSDIRRIEARHSEINALYTSVRDLVLEFEHHGNVSPIKHFKVQGFQKILMGDSVHFAVDGEVL